MNLNLKNMGNYKNQMNEFQWARFRFLEHTNFDMEKTREYFDFMLGAEDRRFLQQREAEDCVFFVDDKGRAFLYDELHPEVPDNVRYVGITQGKLGIEVSLADSAEGKPIPLIGPKSKDFVDHYSFKETFEDAACDFGGHLYLEVLLNEGLNEKADIGLSEHIPTLGELYLLCLNKKRINKFIEIAGGTPLSGGVYWSSTEKNKDCAWCLNFDNGYAFTAKKREFDAFVRPVSQVPPF